MAAPQSLGNPQITGDTVEALRSSVQFWSQQIFNHLDTLTGARGTPTLLSSMNANGHSIQKLGIPLNDTDVQRVDQCLHLNATGTAYDAQELSIDRLKRAVNDQEAVAFAQVQDLITAAAVAFNNEPYITAVASTSLTADRVLTPEASVLTLTDNGANNTIDIAVAANGITDAKLRQGNATSVIGRSANSTGDVADIAASADNQILARTGGALAWTATPTVTSINFGDEDLDTYDEGTFTITGTGFSTDPTGTAIYVKVGNMVTLFIPQLTGTSDTTTFTLTGVPSAIQTVRGMESLAIRFVDNGTTGTTPGELAIFSGSTAWQMFTDFAGGAWTGSGTKTLEPSVFNYLLT